MAKKITAASKASAAIVRDRLEACLESLRAELGIEIKVGGITYYPSRGRFTTKLEFNITRADDSGNVVTPEARNYTVTGEFFGLPAAALFTIITVNGRQVKIMGLKIRNSKYPVLLEDVKTKKVYVYTTEAVRAAIITRDGKK